MIAATKPPAAAPATIAIGNGLSASRMNHVKKRSYEQFTPNF